MSSPLLVGEWDQQKLAQQRSDTFVWGGIVMGKPVCRMTLKELVEYLYSLQEGNMNTSSRHAAEFDEIFVVRGCGYFSADMNYETFCQATEGREVKLACLN